MLIAFFIYLQSVKELYNLSQILQQKAQSSVVIIFCPIKKQMIEQNSLSYRFGGISEMNYGKMGNVSTMVKSVMATKKVKKAVQITLFQNKHPLFEPLSLRC